MKNKSPRLGKVQLEIMRVLWKRGAATAREITDELSLEKPIAHSTVQTLLRALEAKGAVTHERQNRTFVFRAVHEETEITTSATREMLSRLFHGSASGLVAHLLTHEKISRAELRKIRKLIEEAEGK